MILFMGWAVACRDNDAPINTLLLPALPASQFTTPNPTQPRLPCFSPYQVPYRIDLLRDGETITCDNPAEFPPAGEIAAWHEPVVDATIIVPNAYLGATLSLCHEMRGEQQARRAFFFFLRFDCCLEIGFGFGVGVDTAFLLL